jgi:hypothetical protein
VVPMDDQFEDPVRRWEDNINMDCREISYEDGRL